MITTMKDGLKGIAPLYRDLRASIGRYTSPIFTMTDRQIMESPIEDNDEAEKVLLDLANEMNQIAKRLIDAREHLQLRRRVIKDRQREKCLNNK